MTVSIIIVSYNTSSLTLAAIDSAIEELSIYDGGRGSQIIVVDNKSSDDSVVKIREARAASKIPILLIENKVNRGFGAANNQAAARASTNVLLFLNSDALLQKGSLNNLLSVFSQSGNSDNVLSSNHNRLDRIGLASPQLFFPDGRPQPQGGDIPTLISLIGHWLLLAKVPIISRFFPSTQRQLFFSNESLSVKVGWVAGTALAVSKECWDEIGGFDEHIFMYAEDVELCIRAQKHLWDVVLVPQSQVTHHGSASGNSLSARRGEVLSYNYLIKKHFPSWQVPIASTIISLGIIIRALVWRFSDPELSSLYFSLLTKLKQIEH